MQKQTISRAQRGAVLVVGLIFLAILSLLGAAAYTVATQEERMSGNSRDRLRAAEAAEASLRDCEAQVAGFTGLPAFNGTGGMYEVPSLGSLPKVETVDWKNSTATRVLAATVADVALQPRCIGEKFATTDVRAENNEQSMPQALEEVTVYRFSAVGYGINPNTSVMVQSTFRRQ